ncbi:hypothetical protein G8A07_05445 [Roseateles sp. DAIF2]|uniref:hypothetical protein n=1 Tax=Roseateles sp. DAIF2 TaxID=2714952 RepID=UPI0018A260B4|nr:hypothetical protein [Roseateles sp. DAIF2]QPF72431.1 hypothetical protein G8A07_05445 [Roseateles sp. DAIF2]
MSHGNNKSTPVLALVAAFAATSAQAAADPDESTRRQERRAQVQQQLRAAQVELYCDHDSQALRLMRETRQALLAQPDPSSLRAVDQVIWLLRRGETAQAIAALESARAAQRVPQA